MKLVCFLYPLHREKMINEITYAISKDFDEFNHFLEKNLYSRVNIINSITKYLIKNKGKQFKNINNRRYYRYKCFQ